jgi:hypothetical protein
MCRSYAVGLFSADLKASPLINTPPFGLLHGIATQTFELNGSQGVRVSFCNRVTLNVFDGLFVFV